MPTLPNLRELTVEGTLTFNLSAPFQRFPVRRPDESSGSDMDEEEIAPGVSDLAFRGRFARAGQALWAFVRDRRPHIPRDTSLSPPIAVGAFVDEFGRDILQRGAHPVNRFDPSTHPGLRTLRVSRKIFDTLGQTKKDGLFAGFSPGPDEASILTAPRAGRGLGLRIHRGERYGRYEEMRDRTRTHSSAGETSADEHPELWSEATLAQAMYDPPQLEDEEDDPGWRYWSPIMGSSRVSGQGGSGSGSGSTWEGAGGPPPVSSPVASRWAIDDGYESEYGGDDEWEA